MHDGDRVIVCLMSDTLERLRIIKRRHDFYNRLLTVVLTLPVCAFGGALWLAEVALETQHKTVTGLVIMLLALVFYKIPYFSYRLNRRWLEKSGGDLSLIGSNWRQYKLRILNQPLY